MADSEWYRLDPESSPNNYPNFEAADEAAQVAAKRGADEVAVVRCTETVVRRYTRQVTLSVEDVSKAT